MADNIDEKLINSVFNYEILYDLGNKYYYDTANLDKRMLGNKLLRTWEYQVRKQQFSTCFT